MKRWPIVLLIAIAVLIFLTPGIVGRLAEKNLDQTLSWLEEENDDIAITSELFDRGWFTSEGRHRVTAKNGALLEVFATTDNAGNGEQPSLLIDTRLDHGLVPITSLGREEGSLTPGLASSVSTLHIDNGSGEITDLPGKIYSNIGLTGNTTLHYLMDEGSTTDEGALIRWSGADITVNAEAESRSFSAKGTIKPTSIDSEGVMTEVGAVVFDIVQDRSEYSFGIGSVNFTVDSVAVTSPTQPNAGFGNISIDAASELVGGRVNAVSSIELGEVIMPGLGAMNMFMDVDANGLDADSLEAIVSALRAAQSDGQSGAALDDLLPQVESDLETFVMQGVELDITRFDISLPQGDLLAAINITIPQSDAGASFAWPSVILATTASVDLTVSASLFEMAQAMYAEADTLLAMGVLKRQGENYEMEVRYASGLLTINGAPMPIPLGLPQ